MMTEQNVLTDYKHAELPLPDAYQRWHLYGAGLQNVGKTGIPETVALVHSGPDELLVRHDACGICYSDIKIINLGGNHPRLVGRDLAANPVVMGHEVALTIVEVGANLEGRFQVGERFIVQADIYYKGTNLAYGYAITGGMSQFGLIGPEVIDGDEGCYLLPIKDKTGYAEAALVEPWACVEAAYHWQHRTTPDSLVEYWVENGIPSLAQKQEDGSYKGESISDIPGGLHPDDKFQDIKISGRPDAEAFEAACARLDKGGLVRLALDTPFSRPVKIDIGRIHYDGHTYIGPQENYRSELKAGGVCWFIGTAGPMGMMHVQRALSLPHPPRLIIGTDRHNARLAAVQDRFGKLAAERGVELRLFNVRETGLPDMVTIAPNGCDDIVVMVPSIEAIEEGFPYLAQDGILNVFAGVARGTMAILDMSDVVFKNVRIVGTSGSSIADMRMVRDKLESGTLGTGASVAAIGGLEAFKDGLEAVQNARFPGKTVIFPQIENLPLTALPDLAAVRPDVYARLQDGKFWTNAAEEELLKESLET